MDVTKVCKICGQVFEHGISPSHINRKHHMTKSDYEAQYGRIFLPWNTTEIVTCRYCNQPIERPKWHRTMNTAGHVCQACWKQPIAVTCGACHKVFPIDRSRYTFWVKNNSTFFCSDECHSKGVGSLISQAKKVNGAEISAKLKANWADPVLRQKRLDGMIPAAFKRRQRTLVTCANCGVQLEKCNCHVRNNRTGNFYCTTKCQLEDPKFYRASMLAAQRRPTKPEQLLIEFFKEYNLPYSYTGDGTTFIGRKNPDFIHTSDKKAIDLFGDYFHSKKFLEKKGVAYDPEGKARIEAFKQHGYDLTVIWEKELNDPNWKQILLAKLR